MVLENQYLVLFLIEFLTIQQMARVKNWFIKEEKAQSTNDI